MCKYFNVLFLSRQAIFWLLLKTVLVETADNILSYWLWKLRLTKYYVSLARCGEQIDIIIVFTNTIYFFKRRTKAVFFQSIFSLQVPLYPHFMVAE